MSYTGLDISKEVVAWEKKKKEMGVPMWISPLYLQILPSRFNQNGSKYLGKKKFPEVSKSKT